MSYFLPHQLMVMFILGVLISSPVLAQTQVESAAQEMPQDELNAIPAALEGYDIIMCYTPSGPQKGSASYQTLYDNKRYLFTNLENQQQFSQDPEKYLPEFEEYCACSVSDNEPVMADPKVFKVTEGKLVLFKDEAALSLSLERG